MKTSAWPLHMAVYERLNTDTDLNNLITGVYDHVRETAVMPYVTIGEQTISTFDTKINSGENITLVLHGWSNYSGKKEAYEMIDLMLQAFSKAPLSIEGGFSLVNFRRESGTTVIQDIDGSTYHAILRVRAYITQ